MSSQLPQEPTFDKYNAIYDNNYEKEGPEFGEVWAKKQLFAQEMSGQYILTPEVPKNIAGLINRTDKTRRLPSTARFFRTTTSFERNGMFNIQTPALNVRYGAVSFFALLGWGWCAFQINAYNAIHERDNYEEGSIYDKLATRNLPPSKMWNRPG